MKFGLLLLHSTFAIGCNKLSIEPEASGAAERVQEYILEAHEWESNSFAKRTPELERELEDARNTWITTGLRPNSESIHDASTNDDPSVLWKE